MDVSIFLAKFWGWYLIFFFFILSYNPKRTKQILSFLEDEKFSILVAFIAIVIGLLNILFHNIWDSSATVIVSLIGWIALFKGLMLFAFPSLALKAIDFISLKLIQVIYVLLFLMGLYLLNTGYGLIQY